MKKLVLSLVVAMGILTFSTYAMADDFTNGGFENGNLSGWTQGGGWWYGGWPLDPASYLPGGSNYAAGAAVNNVVGVGTDPYSGLSTVYNGSYAAKVNDDYNNYSVSVISQSVKSYNSSNIYFAWAAVLEGSHGPTDSDNFTLKLVDDTTKSTVYAITWDSADAASSSLFTDVNNVFYTQWQVENLAVTQGDDYTLTLLASDCPYGGHWGYAYLDGFGGAPPVNNTTVPEPNGLLLLGTGLLGLAFVLFRKNKTASFTLR